MKFVTMPKKMKAHSKAKTAQTIFIFAILIVPIAHFLFMWGFINIKSITMAFQTNNKAFAFDNFKIAWSNITYPGNDLNIAVKNTFLYFSNSILIIFPLTLIASYFIYKKIAGYKFFRFIFYLPAIISGVAMVHAFKTLIGTDGPVDKILHLFGKNVPDVGYLGSAKTATKTILVYCVWTCFTGNVLLFGGTMNRIPTDIIESAKLEGCSPLKEIIFIVLPLTWPTLSTMLILALTGLFTAGGPILIMTNGQFGTTTIGFWIFNSVYGGGLVGGTPNYNMIAAIGLIFTLAGIPIIVVGRYFIEKVPTVEY